MREECVQLNQKLDSCPHKDDGETWDGRSGDGEELKELKPVQATETTDLVADQNVGTEKEE